MTDPAILPIALPIARATRSRPPVLRLRVTGLVVAAGLALVAATAPARAQQLTNENLGGWIAGAVALGLIAKALDEQRDRERDRDRRRAAAAAPVHEPPVHTPVVPERIREFRPVPAACLVRYRVGDRPVDYYTAACLDRTYRDADLLPGACRQSIRTPGGIEAVYAPSCLSDRGFRLARADGHGDHRGRDRDDWDRDGWDRSSWDHGDRNPWDIPGRTWR